MNRILILIVLLPLSMEISAQIGGLSASKLNAVCVDVVENRMIEVEPGFFYSSGSKYWDHNRHLENRFNTTDSVWNASGMQFRFTYGLFGKLEVGVTLPLDVSTTSWGVKYIVAQNKKIGFAFIGGLNIPWGNKIQDKSVRTEDNATQAGLGTVFSCQYNNNLSFDINAQYNCFIKHPISLKSGLLYLNADAGYYIFSHTLQLIAGFGYQYDSRDIMSRFLFTFYPGITIETGKKYIIVLDTPIDIFGKNTDKTVGFSLALTLTID